MPCSLSLFLTQLNVVSSQKPSLTTLRVAPAPASATYSLITPFCLLEKVSLSFFWVFVSVFSTVLPTLEWKLLEVGGCVLLTYHSILGQCWHELGTQEILVK